MKLLVVAVGQRQPAWADEAWADFAKRFPPELRLELKACKAEPRSGRSAAQLVAAEAQRIGLASLSRDIFLDDERTTEAITAQFEAAIKLAHKQGSVVMIGHPYPMTLDVLERELPRLKAQGIQWIDLRRMISVRGNQATAAHGKNGIYR